jgi:hypothetical protein
MIDLHQNVVIGNRTPQRPGDEQFQLISFFPPNIAASQYLIAEVNQELGAFSTAPQ